MRPAFHYAPAANWLSDPNGLVYHAGEWHLFYQYNPHGEDWGHMSWGHAVSPDLVAWQELPVALAEDERHMIFSGSAVIDSGNAAGFGQDAMVALYTGHARGEPANQSQCLAYSTDRGLSWEKYAGNPVIDRGLADFRDPNVFWHAATGRWIMVVVLSNEQRGVIYASHDLKQWDELSVIHGANAPGEVWECPLLIELPVEGTGETRWLFKVDVLRGGPGSGAIYQAGTFDGVRFHPDGPSLEPRWQVADYGADFYAAISWHEPRDAQGRPSWIGWMGNHAYQGRMPKQGWRGVMSLPRRIALRFDHDRYVLVQSVEPGLLEQVDVCAPFARQVPSACRIALPRDCDFAYGLSDQHSRMLRIERRGTDIFVTRRDPQSPFLDTVQRASLKAGADLQVWIDGGTLELFGANGEVSLSLQHRLTGSLLSAEFLDGRPG